MAALVLNPSHPVYGIGPCGDDDPLSRQTRPTQSRIVPNRPIYRVIDLI
jgi:hypothetical protein